MLDLGLRSDGAPAIVATIVLDPSQAGYVRRRVRGLPRIPYPLSTKPMCVAAGPASPVLPAQRLQDVSPDVRRRTEIEEGVESVRRLQAARTRSERQRRLGAATHATGVFDQCVREGGQHTPVRALNKCQIYAIGGEADVVDGERGHLAGVCPGCGWGDDGAFGTVSCLRIRWYGIGDNRRRRRRVRLLEGLREGGPTGAERNGYFGSGGALRGSYMRGMTVARA